MFSIKSQKGYMSVLLCILMVLIISVAGICIDASFIINSKAKLMTATKYAAISATSYNIIVDENLVITAQPEDVERILKMNFESASLQDFYITPGKNNECTVIAKAQVRLFFMKIFGIENTVIEESYTAIRNLSL